MELAVNLAATAATFIALSPWWARVRYYGIARSPRIWAGAAKVAALHVFILGGIWL
ncbi:hypothetical protein [Phenylobacterium ferrooxidans]|uniref:Uncharacterized protein n=1 Tax=Phenylobacterium ferrooxidans TaxID=2982689 RepID=A0ABW6CM08_9CAUL